jgi:hypothetical protein
VDQFGWKIHTGTSSKKLRASHKRDAVGNDLRAGDGITALIRPHKLVGDPHIVIFFVIQNVGCSQGKRESPAAFILHGDGRVPIGDFQGHFIYKAEKGDHVRDILCVLHRGGDDCFGWLTYAIIDRINRNED